MIRPSDDAKREEPLPSGDGLPAQDSSEAPEAAEEIDGDPSDSYLVHLDRFEGPLDLLLYLIQRDEIDIYDIPIAHITKQYLSYIDLLDVFDLDNAGEFLVMAATLMRIKARMLLPVQRPDEGDEDDIDPRDELVRRLLEYKKYKEAAQSLADKEEHRRDFYARGSEYSFVDADQEPPEFTLSLFDLLGAVRNVLERIEQMPTHHVRHEVFTVDAQTEVVLQKLEVELQTRFEDVFAESRSKMEVVVTFVALLELLKRGRIQVRQLTPYSEMWLSLSDTPEEPDEESASAEAADAS